MKRLERLLAIIGKEWLQVFRDPSALLIAFVLPAIMLFIFGYALSLDTKDIKTGIVLEDSNSLARSFYNALFASPSFDVLYYSNRFSAEKGLQDGTIGAAIVIPNNFSREIEQGNLGVIQVLSDGGDANLALITENYIRAAFINWTTGRLNESGGASIASKLELKTKTLYNSAQISRNSIVPGSIALVLAMIGTLLTCMIVAREWERGTMEATLATSVGKFEMFTGKLIPYFILGLLGALGSLAIARFLFDTPFRGSLLAYLLTSSVFLLGTTSQGLLISSVCRDQSMASQVALLTSFLPNFLLSGVLFEIDAMPKILQLITFVFPARYYVVCMQTIFMAGDVWSVLRPQLGGMGIIGIVIFISAIAKTPKRL